MKRGVALTRRAAGNTSAPMMMPMDALPSCGPKPARPRSAWIALVLGLLAVDAIAADRADIACVLLTKEGKVDVAPAGSRQWTVASTNQLLHTGDRLRTGLRSRATLRWSDLSVLRVDELTSLEIQPPAAAGAKPQLDLKSGASYFFSREQPASIQFRTPVASGAIRGTEFHLAVAEDGRTVLALLDGEVVLTNANGHATLHGGQQGTVDPGQAPTTSPLLDAVNIIQWALYYPAVIHPVDVGWSAQDREPFHSSVTAYESGDLLSALSRWPENRVPASDPERAWRATLLLAAGRVDQAQAELERLASPAPVGRALREVIAAVKNQSPSVLPAPATASEWLARSYVWQSQAHLPEALDAARHATTLAPGFGAAWIRVAELEFGFGRARAALEALERGRTLSPRNAQGAVLEGFLLAARNDWTGARRRFEEAIALDGALSTAWLGRGLVQIRAGRPAAGREDLQVAAALEPRRAVLRSYLGKAFHQAGDLAHARKELELAKQLDPNDPTAWLYAALLKFQANEVNDAVRDLEGSKDRNDHRSLFRSRLLLDQDQAVRRANLAAIYRDAGLIDYSAQEGARAVAADYGNFSAHLFLANSYDALRDPKLINLRYESPWYSEWLIASLLAPAGAGALSQTVSQQEYSRLFDANQLGVFSSTEYTSRGDWFQLASQYGQFDQTSYALDGGYRTQNGYRPNNDLEQRYLAARVKQQLSPNDSLFVQVSAADLESGDVAQYYDQRQASTTLRTHETQVPNALIGYHRTWAPGLHTLFLGGRFDDTLRLNDPAPALLYWETFISPFTGRTNVNVRNVAWPLDFERDLVVYSGELQQIWQTPVQTLLLGGRFQQGTAEAKDTLEQRLPAGLPSQFYHQSVDANLDRISLYAYETVTLADTLRVTAGVSYDRLHYPRNLDTAPISDEEATKDQVSPKAGIVWSPWPDTHLRGAYTRSLGGVFFDNSVRLEPTQIGGFTQAYRSLVPESVAGLVPGTEFETWGAGVDHTLRRTGTYLVLQGELLHSDGDRTVGILTNSVAPVPDSLSGTPQSLDYNERSLVVAANQLLGQGFALGARYRITDADMTTRFTAIPSTATGVRAYNQDVNATLHQVQLSALYNHRCGFFAEFAALWSQQSNRGDAAGMPGDDFWHFDAFAGYRFFERRAEARLGVLNLTDRDYRLYPLTLYRELPRERTLVVNFKFFY